MARRCPRILKRPAGAHFGVVASLTAARIIPLVSGLASAYLTARWLGPSGRGQYSFSTAAASLFAAVFGLTLYVPLAAAVRLQDNAAVSALNWTIHVLTAASAVATAIWISASGVSGVWFGLLVGSGAALALRTLVLGRTVQGLGHHRTYRLAVTMQSLSLLSALTALAVANLLAVPTALGAWTISHLPALWLISRSIGGRRLPASPPWADVRSAARRSFSDWIANHSGNIGLLFLGRADLAVLGFVASSSEIGWYAVALLVAELSWLMTEVSSMWILDEGDTPASQIARKEKYRRAISISYSSALTGATLTWLMYVPVARVVLPQFIDSYEFLRILLPGIVLGSGLRPSLAMLQASGRFTEVRVLGLAAVFVAMLYIPLGVLGGATAVAWLSSAGYAAIGMGSVIFVTRKLSV